MEYTREYWEPRIATNPNRFRKQNESTDYVELINEPEAITQTGTAVTAERLNNSESGIDGAVAGVNEIEGVVNFLVHTTGYASQGVSSGNYEGAFSFGSDIYVKKSGTWYKQTGGVNEPASLSLTGVMFTDGTHIYNARADGWIYKQANGIGDYTQFVQFPSGATAFASDQTIIYASVPGGYIYKKLTADLGFSAISEQRNWKHIVISGGDCFAFTYGTGAGMYIQQNKTGSFVYISSFSADFSFSYKNDLYCNDSSSAVVVFKNGVASQQTLPTAPAFCGGIAELSGYIHYFPYASGSPSVSQILTGNTFRASSSFTLPSMPDGARKRILNTHATDAITVTAYSGTTIEGQATMTLSAGHEVELELIGTDWRKTGWNEKALLTYSAPVDCTSREAEYTGDGGGATIKDRAGNGNNLAATNITYVNGKYCKEMSFNSSSSYAQASSPVIGTTGTVAVRFKINSTSATYVLFDTRNSSTNLYGMALVIVSNVLAIRFSGSTEQNFNLASGIGTGYRTVEIAFDATNIYFYFVGALISTTAITVSGFTHTNNLLLGRGQSTSTPAYLNGIISHFRYDSRIWTADEARAWSLNPISIDSRI